MCVRLDQALGARDWEDSLRCPRQHTQTFTAVDRIRHQGTHSEAAGTQNVTRSANNCRELITQPPMLTFASQSV